MAHRQLGELFHLIGLTLFSECSRNMFRDLNASKHWRDRAAKMRALAENMANAGAVQLMNDLADDYDKLADRAEEGTKSDCGGDDRGMAAGVNSGRKRKMSACQRAEAIKRCAAGETLVSIAKSYGVSRSTILRLMNQSGRDSQERRSTELRSP